MKKFLILLLLLGFSFSTCFAKSLNGTAKTKRIPAGTVFQIEFLQPVSTFSSLEGDSFTAKIDSNLDGDYSMILPMGTIIRGSVQSAQMAKRFSRGGRLYLDFDHVVTPTGRQIPLDMAVVDYDNIYFDGALYKNLGYGEALQGNFEKSKQITKTAADYGFNAGNSAPGIQYVTGPACAVGGFIGGAGYYVGQFFWDMFQKGQDVNINAGDKMSVKLINPIDVPVY